MDPANNVSPTKQRAVTRHPSIANPPGVCRCCQAVYAQTPDRNRLAISRHSLAPGPPPEEIDILRSRYTGASEIQNLINPSA